MDSTVTCSHVIREIANVKIFAWLNRIHDSLDCFIFFGIYIETTDLSRKVFSNVHDGIPSSFQ